MTGGKPLLFNFSLLVLYKFLTFLTDTSQGFTISGMDQPFVFSGCVTLLSPVCFHCCQKGSVFKFPFLFLFDCLCSRPVALLLLKGGLWEHRRLFYTRLQEGHIQNQWGNDSALFLPSRILSDELGYQEHQMGALLAWQIEGRGEMRGREERNERSKREESCYSCEMWNA